MFALAVMNSREVKSDDRAEKISLKKQIKSYFNFDGNQPPAATSTDKEKNKSLNQNNGSSNLSKKLVIEKKDIVPEKTLQE